MYRCKALLVALAASVAVQEDGTFVGCEDIHFTPGWPVHFQVLATVKF
jgi:hypothetical protein